MHMHVNLFPYRMGDESGVQVQVHENENEKEHDKVWLISLFADAGFVALLTIEVAQRSFSGSLSLSCTSIYFSYRMK